MKPAKRKLSTFKMASEITGNLPVQNTGATKYFFWKAASTLNTCLMGKISLPMCKKQIKQSTPKDNFIDSIF